MFFGAMALAAVLAGCSYGGVAVTTNNQAVIVRNDNILFGLLRKTMVCQVTDAGLTNCSTSQTNP